ncbi:hypothetical protein ACFVYC_15080 [Pseudarthrobacter sp. NPDC058329]|uniref:hypothetical protein n=1 Tax=Pseudarthrobacter sp. NPDC058329 TaxID=3346448 RepID=UPI0036DAA2C1
MTDLLAFGTLWPMGGALRERVGREHAAFRSRAAELDAPAGQVQVLNELLNLVDERDFVEARAVWVTCKTKLARPTRLGVLPHVRAGLKNADLLTSHRVTEVFDDGRSVALQNRRPVVAMTVEVAGFLWLKDSWVRNGKGGLY